MRKLIYFVILLVIVAAVTPWLDGFYCKKNLFNLIATINQNNTTQLNILEYHQGWFSSQVKINIKPSMPQNDSSNRMPPVEFILNGSISHGPIVYSRSKQKFTFAAAAIQSNLHLPNEIESLLLDKRFTQGVLQISTLVNFNNQWQNQIRIPTINTKFNNIGNLIWQGLTGDYNLQITNNQITSIQSHFIIGPLSATGQAPTNAQVSSQAITTSYEGKRHPLGLWMGDFKISIPALSVKGISGKNIRIANLDLSASNNISNDALYNGTEHFNLQKIEMPEQIIPSIGPASIDLSASNFSVQGLIALSNFIKKSAPADLSKNEFMQLVAKVITPSSTVNSVASFVTTLGSATISETATKLTINPAGSFADILKNSYIQINIRAAAPLVIKLMESYFQSAANKPTTSTENPFANTPPTESQVRIEQFNDQIAALMKQGKLSLYTSMQIMTLQSQNHTPEQFAENLAKLRVAPDVYEEIIKLHNEISNAQPTVVQSPVTKANDLLTKWIKNAYIIQDNNDYISNITMSDGVIKFNGKVMEQSQG